MESMVPGNSKDDTYTEFYFYDEVIRLNGKDYRVKIACEDYRITSFSCIQCKEEGIKESEEWKDHRELLAERMKENPSVMMELYYALQEVPYNFYGYESWYWYEDLYAGYLMDVGAYLGGKGSTGDDTSDVQDSATVKVLEEQGIVKEAVDASVEEEENEAEEAGTLWDDEDQGGSVTYKEESIPIQVIELQDSILILMESYTTVGLYFDPIRQKIVGFHFF